MGFEDEKLTVEQDDSVLVAAIRHPPANSMGQGVLRDLKDLLRIMAEEASLGLPEVKLGLNPGWSGTQRLPRYIGKTKALLFTQDFKEGAKAFLEKRAPVFTGR